MENDVLRNLTENCSPNFFQVFEAQSDSMFDYDISAPLYQHSNLSFAHGAAYDLWQANPSKRYTIIQPVNGSCAGGYGFPDKSKVKTQFKVGDRVEYVDDGEPGTVVEVDQSTSEPDYCVAWASGRQTWEEAADLRNVTPLAAGDMVSLTAKVVSVGVDSKTAMVRIEGMTECYLVPIAFMARKGCPTSGNLV